MKKVRDTALEVLEYIQKSEILYKNGNLTESRRLAKKAVEMEPENATAQNNLGAIHYQLGDLKNAIYHSEKACRLYYANNQYNKSALMNYAASLIGVGKLREAASMLQGCQNTGDPDFTDLLNQVLATQQHKIANGLNEIFQLIKPTQVLFGLMHSYRLGHIAANTEMLLRSIQLGRLDKDNKYILIGPEDPANRQLVEMYKRHVSIIENTELFNAAISYMPLFAQSEHWINTYALFDATQYEEFNSTSKTIYFTSEEEEKGRLELEKIGIQKDDWFVCIFARDAEYLRVHTPNTDWSYHDYRDMDINTYSKAIDFIIDKGGYVVRMGQVINQKLKYKHKKMIHYGGSDIRSDFLDVYLAAKCRFFIGPMSGICDMAAESFEVPFLAVNQAPVGYKPITKNALYIPKKIRRTTDNSYAPFSKLLSEFVNPADPCLNDGNKFRESGYVYENNTESEILAATIEMYEWVTSGSRQRADVGDQELLNSYFALYPENHFNRKNKTPIAMSFLKHNRDLYFD